MPYLGRELTSGNYLKLDDITSQFDGSTTTFQLKSGGSNFFPGSSFSLLVSVAGVIQEADSAYQINNNEITFATAPGASDDAFIIVLGLALGIGVPGDGTVGLNQLQDSAKLGISTNGVFVGGGVTSINFAGPGVTTAFVTPSTGIATVFFQGGGGGVGAAGTWASDSVGVATSKVVGVGTAQAVGTANSEGALQALGNIAITDGALLIDNDISSSINVPAGKNGLLIGTVNVAIGATIDVATGSVLVVV
jgi:hypothetical protein|tara:strand:- start:3223 stop:3972 length:750 start_codon:yes stop_codon:yes gene_type:complete